MLDLFTKEHLKAIKDYNKEYKYRKNTGYWNLALSLTIFGLLYIYYLFIIINNEDANLALIILSSVILLGIYIFYSLRKFKEKSKDFTSIRKNVFIKNYVDYLKIIKGMDGEPPLKIECNKNDNTLPISEKKLKEVISMNKEATSSLKKIFKLNFALVPLSFTIFITWINLTVVDDAAKSGYMIFFVVALAIGYFALSFVLSIVESFVNKEVYILEELTNILYEVHLLKLINEEDSFSKDKVTKTS